MKFYTGVTDKNWFEFLRDRKSDEVNFWHPSPRAPFRAFPTGGLFLWKLSALLSFVVGGIFFGLADLE